MINILLSVRRPFSGKILSGEKGWELRKNAPRIPRGNTSHSGSTNPARTGLGPSSACAGWSPGYACATCHSLAALMIL